VGIYDKTNVFRGNSGQRNILVSEVLTEVYSALQEKGYNPIGQIIGYLLSGDPTYITSHRGARQLISQLERDEILEELISYYLQM